MAPRQAWNSRTTRAAVAASLLVVASFTGCERDPSREPSAPALTVASSGFAAHVGGQLIDVRVAPRGVALSPPRTDRAQWRVTLGVASITRAGAAGLPSLAPLAVADLAPGAARCVASRCELARGQGVTERFLDSSSGVEQVIELARRPTGHGALRIGVEISGAQMIQTPARTEAMLRPDGATESLRYAGLAVRDANGTQLDAWLEPNATGIDIVVRDEGATYPIVVDPFIARSVQVLPYSGWAVDMSGDTTVIGATYDDVAGLAHPGTAPVYVRTGGTEVLQQVLSAADPTADSFFGIAVAISGDTIAVGCTHGWDDMGMPNVGDVYVFVRSGTTWTQQAKLFDEGGGPLKSYGYSLSLSGDTLAVGARWDDHDGLTDAGAVYVYTRSGTTWTLQQKITASDANNYDTFGFAQSLSGDTLAIGAYRRDLDPNPDAGGVYIYTRAGTVWTEQAILQRATYGTGDYLGYAVALEGDTLIATVPGLDSGGITDRGGAAVFTRSGTTWTERATLVGSASVADDQLGDCVVLEGGTALIGGSLADIGPLVDAGAFYAYTGAGAVWTESAFGQPPTPAAGAYFGYALDQHLGTAFVGAPSPGTGTPLTYVFEVGLDRGDTCTADTECASGHCTDGVCCDTACGGGMPDCQGCSLATGATTAGTCAVYAADTTCRAATGVCDVDEVCDGTAGTCPTDVFQSDGTPCADTMVCNGDEVCAAGTCAPGSPLACDDKDSCTTDSCVEPDGCMHVNDACTDAGSGTDAGTADVDAGTGPGTDSGAGTRDGGGTGGSDAGTTSPPGDDGGCGCRAAGPSSSRPAFVAVGVVALVLATRRRRRRA